MIKKRKTKDRGKKSESLKLPIVQSEPFEARILSMDEYFQFVQFNLQHNFDRKAYETSKKLMTVNVPFILK